MRWRSRAGLLRHSREGGNPSSTAIDDLSVQKHIISAQAHRVISDCAEMTRCYCEERERQSEYLIRPLILCRVGDS